MKGLILEVLTVESVTVVDVAETGRRKREKKRAQDSIWGNHGGWLEWERWREKFS